MVADVTVRPNRGVHAQSGEARRAEPHSAVGAAGQFAVSPKIPSLRQNAYCATPFVLKVAL